ncbi:CobW family GTP-binding protein [Ectobacillus ponti]|uniref:GTP-binding protein n=1 Tax=Ectobacillus ponti TaxID=2961894 RepID=A0AA41X4I8_9BACI|nr:GTP-binding protein [Ectobacillus ponti]MCP8968587.1 GTP-binding protein [Ectobacillus ponti]
MKKRIPVYILSGFLGSGKTTVLLRMIAACKERGQRPAIILNELGKVNVEEHLFADEDLNELLDGCICCTIQSNFRAVLDDLAAQSPDVLLIEGTGVANPVELIEVLTEPRYTGYFHLHSLISVVDASRFLEYQSIFLSSGAMRKLFRDQIRCASYVVLNKTDAISERKLAGIVEKVRALVGEHVPLYNTTFGQIHADELFQERIMVHHADEPASRGQHHAAVRAVRMDAVPPLEQKQLQDWIKSLPDSIYRGKGVLRLQGKEGLYELQYASGQLAIKHMYMDNPNVTAALVFIGEGETAKALVQSFQKEFGKVRLR